MLLETLKTLEVSILDPKVRCSADLLGALLHPELKEIGCSGRLYTREELLAHVSSEGKQRAIWAQDFTVEFSSAGIALLLYRSADIGKGGELLCHAMRASLWQLTDAGWKLRFHQGTPTGAFERNRD